MANVEFLQQEVIRLEKLLSEEVKKREIVEKQVSSLIEEVNRIKDWINSPHEIEIEEKDESNFSYSDEENAKPKEKESSSNGIEELTNLDTSKLGEIILSGWLLKRMKNGGWNTRWVVLRKNGSLLCYLQPDSRHPIQVIHLQNARLFKLVAKKGKVKPLHFNVFSSKENCMFKAQTKLEKEKWCNVIKEYILVEENKQDKDGGYSLSEESPNQVSNKPEEGESNKDLIKEGWIEKKSTNVWRKKYAVLYRNGPIFLHEDKNADSASAIIYLNNAKVFAHAEKNGVPKPLCFNIRSTNKNFLLKASSKEEKDEWCAAIRANIRASVIPVMLQDIPESGSFIIAKERMQEIRDIINKEQEPFKGDGSSKKLVVVDSTQMALKSSSTEYGDQMILLEDEPKRPSSPLGDSTEKREKKKREKKEKKEKKERSSSPKMTRLQRASDSSQLELIAHNNQN